MSKAIAFLCHPYHRGGVTSWMLLAALEADRRGIDTYFITTDPVSSFISGADRATMLSLFFDTNHNIKIIAPKVGYEFELGTEEFKSLTYTTAITSNVPVHTPIIISDDAAVWKASAMLASSYPMLAVLHSDDQHYYHQAEQYEKYVNTFTAVSNRIAVKANIKSNKVVVIPCGIDVKKFPVKTEQTAGDSLTIIWIGRVEEKQKRVSDISLIALALRAHNIKFKLQVLGTGPELEWLKNDILSKGVQDFVEIKGWQSATQISETLTKSDVLLQTSNYEGMSVAVMEALATGCAVVSTRVSGVEDYENTDLAKDCLFLYEIGKIEEAVSRLKQVINIDTASRKAARSFAENKFSIESCITHYESVIDTQLRNVSVEYPVGNTWLIKLKSRLVAILRKLKYETSKILGKL